MKKMRSAAVLTKLGKSLKDSSGLSSERFHFCPIGPNKTCQPLTVVSVCDQETTEECYY
uniref:Uncharacterized protein n=1 Tax=Arion vulgaris TaxID=1028688 RepID=A0A0B7A652_9EUPU